MDLLHVDGACERLPTPNKIVYKEGFKGVLYIKRG
jgi:hypothetical protein